MGGPNGGYLAAIALRAAGEVAEIQRPASFYCHFLSSPAFDLVELKVSVLKQGRRAESFAVEMTQQGKPILLDTYGFPAAYRKYRSWEYLAPNLDTSVWFHHFNPGCEWLLIDHECIVADHGLMGVSGRVWDTDGHLLATGSAQLCCIPNPSAARLQTAR